MVNRGWQAVSLPICNLKTIGAIQERPQLFNNLPGPKSKLCTILIGSQWYVAESL